MGVEGADLRRKRDHEARALPQLAGELPRALLSATARFLGVLFCSSGLAYAVVPAVNGHRAFFTPVSISLAIVESLGLGFCVFGIRRWRWSLLLTGLAFATTVLAARK